MNKFEFASKYEDYVALKKETPERIMLTVVQPPTIIVYEFLIVPGEKEDRKLIQQFFFDAIESGFTAMLIAQVPAGFVPQKTEHAMAISYLVEFT